MSARRTRDPGRRVRPRRPAAPRRVVRGGFTLIEILAVVAIFALLAGLLAPRVGSIGGRALWQNAEQIAGRIELARTRAVVTGVPHRLLVDLDEGGYRIEWQVSEARARGEEPEPEPTPGTDLSGRQPIDLAPPEVEAFDFHPLPGKVGRFVWLEDPFFFGAVETPEGVVDRGDAVIEFDYDGTATDTSIFLDDGDGRTLVLHVRPLADGVRIHEETG
ncbi:MAG: prepilin-type N-terminal cleavage/methylation domain-containing protein [Myxococcota bacterium]|nr:prepilin-type N-terminal cleavage/methylation domain-containing protein [Myxococcota bacterium]